MPISFKQTSMTFHLYNRELSYIIKILPEGIPVQLYFGAALPDRDDWDHEVGTMFVAIATRSGVHVRPLRLGAQPMRERLRTQTASHAFDLARRYLSGLDFES